MKKVILDLFLAGVIGIWGASPAFAVPPSFYFDLNISATATELEDGRWLYEYTLSAAPAPGDNYNLKDLSHWWIELPEEKIETLSDFNPSLIEDDELVKPETFFNEPVGPFAGKHYGVKWDYSDLITYSFISTHAPVLDENEEIDEDAYLWFAKDGKINGVDAYDFGYALGPNGGHTTPIPEPLSLLLMGSGFGGLAFFRRRK